MRPHDNTATETTALLFKDAVLDRLAERFNVAQFVSFGPGREPRQRFSRVSGFSPNHKFESVTGAVESLMAVSREKSVNIRSFLPDKPQGNKFIYGLTSKESVLSHLQNLATSGLHTIVNETVDVNDLGVSGVIQGGVIEFAPGQIPRFVEKQNLDEVPSFPLGLGRQILELVYGCGSELSAFGVNHRVEFSAHPIKRGWRNEHIILWEMQKYPYETTTPELVWPNAFSKFIGDKAFGLMIGACSDLSVPYTTVFHRPINLRGRIRRLPLFSFGEPTGSPTLWIRTCPPTQQPGKFPTKQGWTDPFKLMADEGSEKELVSCLVQDQVDAEYSGAALTARNGDVIIEGVKGFGDLFMTGREGPALFPEHVQTSVQSLYEKARSKLGPVRFEWAYDGRKVWLLQLHCGVSASVGKMIYPGKPAEFIKFEVSDGLEALRRLVAECRKNGKGIVIFGNVGITSHMADVLRRARVPSRIEHN
jgi:hypothetical protein